MIVVRNLERANWPSNHTRKLSVLLRGRKYEKKIKFLQEGEGAHHRNKRIIVNNLHDLFELLVQVLGPDVDNHLFFLPLDTRWGKLFGIHPLRHRPRAHSISLG